jgi:hypothetical protein
MYNRTDEIRQDRTRCYFFYSMEELMDYFETIKKKRNKTQDDEY